MEPTDWEEEHRRVKQKVAPNAVESCKHCGLWKVKLMESRDEYFKCAIDYQHRYCGGKCSKYVEKKSLFQRIFKRKGTLLDEFS